MKNKYLMLAAMAAAVGLSSCDMDKTPYNSLPDTEALQTVTDFENIRVGIYSALRSSVVGDFYVAPEIQAGDFDAVTGFSNTYGDLYYWNFTSQTGEFATVYSNYQAIIARANYIIDGYNKCDFSNASEFTAKNMTEKVNPAKGDAFFARAYSIFMLSQYFCQAYDESTAGNADTGVSYRLDYSPSSNSSTYPGRNTLAETYARVSDDLDSAAVYVAAQGDACYGYISQDAITALRARVALNKKEYKKAADYAASLIQSGRYALAADRSDLTDIFQNDGGMETILQLTSASASELPPSTGSHYMPTTAGQVPDYVPTQELIDLYSANDYRLPVYFAQTSVSTNDGASAEVSILNKFPEQGALYNKFGASARWMAEPKVFRIAEMYLIAAEGYAEAGDIETAAQYLNEMQENRIRRFSARTYADRTAIMNEIKNERRRELVGEGFRLFDIKRWHEAVKRGTPQNRSICLLPGATTTDMTQPADSYRLTWPIPRHETDVNPQIHQNPGYGK